ncbi:DUF350 domain-containing protein [Bermanella marisrubri]|uniref:DUF350 domain-containing protein n=1 Tax=Bermanella marisrubri TaxID=207949 RepID=Q1N4L0_9GAMM|nr:DUF350 domain-containing protein [Bermanella marisrubri]EAT13418.1 hypothetical protein RED65_01620 [Oceanobacter sp. RED65] [Bermanella marisrubri]QIZ84168.1 DUF350 domain-containing protein [Bermanella marisrubri]
MEWTLTDPSYLMFVVTDLVVIFALVAAMRWLNRFWVSPVNKHPEASNIETGAAVIALMLALTGVTSGEFSLTVWQEAQVVLTYGAIAIVMLMCGAWLQDKLVLPALNLTKATKMGNVEAAFITGAHLIGTAIVIKSALSWVSQDEQLGLLALFIAFVISQFILTLETRLRMLWTSGGLIKAIAEKKRPPVIKAAAQHMGAAMAISGSAQFAMAMQYELGLSIVAWVVSSILFLIAYIALAGLCVKIILPKMEEYEGGRPALEGAIYLGWGFLLPALAS